MVQDRPEQWVGFVQLVRIDHWDMIEQWVSIDQWVRIYQWGRIDL